jgi:hypothetical protein
VKKKGFSMKEEKPLIDKDILLVEYQAAQNSAQHHDTLVWTVTSIIWSGTLVLFGFMLNNIDKKTDYLCLYVVLSILGVLLIVAVMLFTFQFHSIKCQKYKRCKQIELQLAMHQHRDLKYPLKFQSIFYVIITLLFIVIWIIFLSKILK